VTVAGEEDEADEDDGRNDDDDMFSSFLSALASSLITSQSKY
jgi:hypothetical protein